MNCNTTTTHLKADDAWEPKQISKFHFEFSERFIKHFKVT